MAIKVGNSWVSEAAYAYAKKNVETDKQNKGMMQQLSEKFPNTNFTTNTTPFQEKGTNNIAISPNILRQMETNPDKRIEYEALIYDCADLQKSLSSQYAQKGSKLIAQGFIINSDGTLGSWNITKSGGTDLKSSCLLPKNDKNSWFSKMFEKSSKKNVSASVKKDWTA